MCHDIYTFLGNSIEIDATSYSVNPSEIFTLVLSRNLLGHSMSNHLKKWKYVTMMS